MKKMGKKTTSPHPHASAYKNIPAWVFNPGWAPDRHKIHTLAHRKNQRGASRPFPR